MDAGGDPGNQAGDAMVIGNGTSESNRSNCFRVTFTGAVYGLSSFNSSGADYAEFFEWLDGNQNNEDRVGYFVTTKGKKIVKATPNDYVLGVVSGQPCIIGNADEDWLGRWEHDEFGRFILEYLEDDKTEISTDGLSEMDINALRGEPDVQEHDGRLYRVTEKAVDHKTPSWRYKANPNYENAQAYIERKNRPEWSPVGMIGVLAVRDDGSCQVDGFCKVAEDGTATASDYVKGESYRVIERVADNVVKIIFR